MFTDALLRGLKGEAANKGEVTINSLFDYIAREMGSDRQQPMIFGQMTLVITINSWSFFIDFFKDNDIML